MAELDEATIQKRYGPLSHTGRALSLWRGLWPYQVNLDPAKPLSNKKQDANSTPAPESRSP